MKVEVYNRKNACAVEPRPNTAVISITVPGDPAPLREGWDSILRLEFHDATPEEAGDYILFDEAMAMRVLAFLEENTTRDYLIHCDAGFSRSVAVGMFISAWFEAHELTIHELGHTQFHNSHVLRTLNRVGWGASQFGMPEGE